MYISHHTLTENGGRNKNSHNKWQSDGRDFGLTFRKVIYNGPSNFIRKIHLDFASFLSTIRKSSSAVSKISLSNEFVKDNLLYSNSNWQFLYFCAGAGFFRGATGKQ